MIRELSSRIRIMRRWIEIHRQPVIFDTTEHYNKGAVEILRLEVRWLIRMLRIAKRVAGAAALLVIVPSILLFGVA